MFSKFRSKDSNKKEKKASNKKESKKNEQNSPKVTQPSVQQPVSPSKTIVPTASPSPTKSEASAPPTGQPQQPQSNGPLLVVEGSQVLWKKGSLGSGGSSTVLRAEWNGNDIAVKVFKPQHSETRGQNEKQILSKLRHPNIVQYYGEGYVKNQLCLLTSFAENGTLETLLRNPEFELDWTFKIKLATQVAQAMAHLHSKNIAHLDLKSGSVLVTSLSTAAATPSVSLSDFDISIDFNDTNNKSGKLRWGTPDLRWAAPEVLKENKASLKSDVWSYGMLLYEMWSRSYPYEKDDEVDAEAKITSGIRPDISGCPKPFANLIQTCLCKTEDVRPSFDQILNTLRSMVIEEESTKDESSKFPLLPTKQISSPSLPVAPKKIDLVSASVNYSNYGDTSQSKRSLSLLIELNENAKKSLDVTVGNRKELIQEIKNRFSDVLGLDDVDGEEANPLEISLEFFSADHNTFVDLDDLKQLKEDKATIRVKVIQPSSSHYANVIKSTKPKNSLSVALSKFKQLKEVKRQENIGGGNFGAVYKGMMSMTQIVMKRLISSNPSAVEELIAEATILSNIRHPFILNFLGVCELEGELYLCTEFLPNGSLSDFLKNASKEVLSNATLLEMAKSGAVGMDHLSKESIIHRDLAARNLLVAQEGTKYFLKISDFGLSRTLADSQSEYSSSTNVAPIRWTAIEALKTQVYTTASDVWSFGVVLWEMFTLGAKPYWELSRIDAVIEYVESGGRLGKPSRCPDAVYACMMQCWDVNPSNRPSFQRIHEVLDEALRVEQKLVTQKVSQELSKKMDHPVEIEDIDGEEYGDKNNISTYSPSPAIVSSSETQTLEPREALPITDSAMKYIRP